MTMTIPGPSYRRAWAVLFGACVLAACIPDLGVALVEPADAGDVVDGATIDGSDGGLADGSFPYPPELVAEGDTVFHTTSVPPFGNVGCAHCHCNDASGGCNFGAPRIIGKPRSAIANALQTVEEMAPVDLTEHEIDAVAAYLAFLATQQ